MRELIFGELMRFILAFLVLSVVSARGEEFNYGLWGQQEKVEKKVERKVEVKKERRIPAGRNQDWRAFLPSNLPSPLLKLLENPTPENAKRYWRAYEEYVNRLAEVERLIRALQVQYARKVSKEYQLYYFFSPTCPACRRYTPVFFEELYKEGFNLPVKAFVVGDLSLGRAMMAGVGVSRVAVATPRMIEELGLEKAGLPTAVLLTPEGEVVGVWEGGRILELLNYLKEKRDEEISNSVNSDGGK